MSCGILTGCVDGQLPVERKFEGPPVGYATWSLWFGESRFLPSQHLQGELQLATRRLKKPPNRAVCKRKTYVGYKIFDLIPPLQGSGGKVSKSNFESEQGAALSPAKSGPEKQRKQLCILYFLERFVGSPTSMRKPYRNGCEVSVLNSYLQTKNILWYKKGRLPVCLPA